MYTPLQAASFQTAAKTYSAALFGYTSARMYAPISTANLAFQSPGTEESMKLG